MKTSQLFSAIAATVAILGTSNVIAQPPQQQQQQQQGPAAVVELLACTFNNGKNLGYLPAASSRYNTWADQNGVTDYTAATLTPYAFSDQVSYDVIWLGAWPNGAAMAADEAKWFATGAQTLAALQAVTDCGTHALFAAIPIHAPAGPPPERNGITMFQDCKIREGRTPPEAIAAVRQWTDYMAGRGSAGFDAILFPLAGKSSEADYAFKHVHGFGSIEEFGRGIDLFTTGGVQMQNEILGRVIACDSPRIYATERVRQAAQQGQ